MKLKDKYNLVDELGFTFLNRVKAIVLVSFLDEHIDLTHDNNMSYISADTMDVIRMVKMEEFEKLVSDFNDMYVTKFYNRDIDLLLKHIQERSHASLSEKILKIKASGKFVNRLGDVL